jgi:hypothetical protein
VAVVRRLDGRLAGRVPHRVSGAPASTSSTCASYTPEDDVRHIDWNVTARLDEPYVAQYTEDRDITAWLVLDRSASMRFGARARKAAVLTELAVCLARLFTQGGNRVGAIPLRQRSQRVIPPRTGRTHVLRLTHELTSAGRVRPDGPPPTSPPCCAWPPPPRAGAAWSSSSPDFIGDVDWEPALGPPQPPARGRRDPRGGPDGDSTCPTWGWY